MDLQLVAMTADYLDVMMVDNSVVEKVASTVEMMVDLSVDKKVVPMALMLVAMMVD